MGEVVESANNNFWFTLLGVALVYLTLPLTGIWLYRQLINKMNEEGIAAPPTAELFIAFANYGAILVVILTSLLLPWSGIASLAVIYLIFLSPIVMGLMAFRLRNHKSLSVYHLYTFNACLFYIAIAPAALLMLYWLITYFEKSQF